MRRTTSQCRAMRVNVPHKGRRRFMKTCAAAGVGAAGMECSGAAQSVYAAGSDAPEKTI